MDFEKNFNSGRSYGTSGGSSKGGRRSFDHNSSTGGNNKYGRHNNTVGGGNFSDSRGKSDRPKTRKLPDLLTGVLKWFNPEKGFGFIARDDGKPDVFVHLTGFPESVRNSDPRKMKSTIKEGRAVSFHLEIATRYVGGEYKDRTSAVDVEFTSYNANNNDNDNDNDESEDESGYDSSDTYDSKTTIEN